MYNCKFISLISQAFDVMVCLKWFLISYLDNCFAGGRYFTVEPEPTADGFYS